MYIYSTKQKIQVQPQQPQQPSPMGPASQRPDRSPSFLNNNQNNNNNINQLPTSTESFNLSNRFGSDDDDDNVDSGVQSPAAVANANVQYMDTNQQNDTVRKNARITIFRTIVQRVSDLFGFVSSIFNASVQYTVPIDINPVGRMKNKKEGGIETFA